MYHNQKLPPRKKDKEEEEDLPSLSFFCSHLIQTVMSDPAQKKVNLHSTEMDENWPNITSDYDNGN